MTRVVYGTPRKLPRAEALQGRVAVLDIAFAGVGENGFEKVTQRFIDGLGSRLAVWIDHHDHERHPDFASDPRFVLAKKSDHGACPEMVTPEIVARVGAVDTIVCHTDFDGLVSAAKWLCGGREPYPGADRDAVAIDTRMGTPSEAAAMMDRAIRARPADTSLLDLLVSYLTSGLRSSASAHILREAALELIPVENETKRAAQAYRCYPRRSGNEVAYVDVSQGYARLDKTELLLLGQKKAQVSVVVDAMNVLIAAPFDSGLNFLEMFGLAGGMPTRVSLSRKELHFVLERLGVDFV